MCFKHLYFKRKSPGWKKKWKQFGYHRDRRAQFGVWNLGLSYSCKATGVSSFCAGCPQNSAAIQLFSEGVFLFLPSIPSAYPLWPGLLLQGRELRWKAAVAIGKALTMRRRDLVLEWESAGLSGSLFGSCNQHTEREESSRQKKKSSLCLPCLCHTLTTVWRQCLH